MDSGGGERIEAVRTLVRLARQLERASTDLSLSQYRVLAAVAAGQERASRVAARLALGRPAVSAAVEALCRRDLLERAGDAADQRAVALRVTAEGTRLLAATETAMLARVGAVFDRSPEGAALVDALLQLGPVLDAIADERYGRRPAGGR